MAWITIREVTDNEIEKLQKRAKAFCERHSFQEMPSLKAIERVDENLYVIEQEDENKAKYLKQLWSIVVKRATGEKHAKGIAYRSIGYHVD